MARLRRYFGDGFAFHLVQRGNGRMQVFRDRDDYWAYHACLQLCASEEQVSIHGYVLMSNHVHIVATPADSKGLPRMMQGVGRHYVPYFNRRYERSGGLWEGRYRACVIDTERYFMNCLRYVDLNPVRAGVVERPEDYEWSSYRRNALGRPDAMLTSHAVYEQWAKSTKARQEKYRNFCASSIEGDELRQIRDAVHHEWAMGEREFAERATAECGRPAARRRIKLDN